MIACALLHVSGAFAQPPAADPAARPAEATDPAESPVAPLDPAPAPPTAGTIVIKVGGAQQQSEAMVPVLEDLLGSLGAQLDVRLVDRVDVEELGQAFTNAPDFRAGVWIDFSDPSQIRLYLLDPHRDRVLMRDLKRTASNDELVREQAGHVLQTSLEGLLAGAEIGQPRGEVMSRLNPKPPVVDEPPPARPAARPSWRLAARYEALVLSDGPTITDGPGALFALALPIEGHGVDVQLSLQYRRPVVASADVIDAEFMAAAVRAGLVYELLRNSVTWRAGASVGSDLIHAHPKATGSTANAEISLEESKLHNVFVLRLDTELDLNVTPSAAIALQAGVDIDPTGTEFVLKRPSGQRSILSPWVVRPFLSGGVSLP